jgi:hypothetical protein
LGQITAQAASVNAWIASIAWTISVLCTPTTRKFFAEAIPDSLRISIMAKLPDTCDSRNMGAASNMK